jgi:hypothetical protein
VGVANDVKHGFSYEMLSVSKKIFFKKRGQILLNEYELLLCLKRMVSGAKLYCCVMKCG